jgi:hypothetical protein
MASDESTLLAMEYAKESLKVISTLREFCSHIKGYDLELNDAEYLECHLSEFKGIGRIFEFLALAETCDSSVLGWEPSLHFFEIMAEAQAEVQKRELADEDDEPRWDEWVQVDYDEAQIAGTDPMLLDMFCALASGVCDEDDSQKGGLAELVARQEKIRTFVAGFLRRVGLFVGDPLDDYQITPLLRKLLLRRFGDAHDLAASLKSKQHAPAVLSPELNLFIGGVRALCEGFGPDNRTWADAFKRPLSALGGVFCFLGLAKVDTASSLGWEPLPGLLEICRNATTTTTVDPSPCTSDGEDILSAINGMLMKGIDPKLAQRKVQSDIEICHCVLSILGMLRSTDDGKVKPTPQLCEMFVGADAAKAG